MVTMDLSMKNKNNGLWSDQNKLGFTLSHLPFNEAWKILHPEVGMVTVVPSQKTVCKHVNE